VDALRAAATATDAALAAAVPLTRSEFVDVLGTAAADAAIADARILDYLRVFVLLHLSGIRQRAGVA